MTGMVREFSSVRRGNAPGQGEVVNRFVETTSTSYDPEARTVDAVLSVGSPVQRLYGTEILRVTPRAVVLDRVRDGAVLLLDSHDLSGIDRALGTVTRAWFDGGSLVGRIRFNDTEQGRKAEGMVARREISGVSIGYHVLEWEVTDADGDVIDPQNDRIRYDEDLTFTAVRWELYEVSLVTVPADSSAAVRSLALYEGRSVRSLFRNASHRKLLAARLEIDNLLHEQGILPTCEEILAARDRLVVEARAEGLSARTSSRK